MIGLQVREAQSILRGQLAQVTKTMRHIYNDQVLVATAMLDRKEDRSRSKRSILQAEGVSVGFSSEPFRSEERKRGVRGVREGT